MATHPRPKLSAGNNKVTARSSLALSRSWAIPFAPSVQEQQRMKSRCFWSQYFSITGLNLLATAQQSRCKAELGTSPCRLSPSPPLPKSWGTKTRCQHRRKAFHRWQLQGLARDTAAASLRCPGTGWWWQCMAEDHQQTASQGRDSGGNCSLASTHITTCHTGWHYRYFEIEDYSKNKPVLILYFLLYVLQRILGYISFKVPRKHLRSIL